MEIEKVAQAMSWSVMAKVARFIAGFAATILIVRSFDEYDWGILTVLRSIIGFVTVVVLLGAGNALLKYIPMVRIKGGMGTLLTNFRKIFLIQFAVWLLLLILARLSGPILNSFFDKRFERFGFYLQFAVGFVIFDAFMTLITSILQSWYETRKLGIVIICGNGCYIALLVLFLKLDWGIVGVLAAGAMVSLGMSLLLLSHVRDVVKRSPIREGEAPGLEKIMRFSLPFVATGVLNQIVWRHSEVIFLSHFQGAEIAGYFGLAYKIPQLLLEYIPLTIWPIVMAGTSEVYARSSDNLPRAIDLYYRLLYILVIPVAAMGFAFARPFVPILFGSE
ncbi:MAG: oligosaccharide flippase family protein, partial [Candidatus Krumholzibacteria bacterium]|nr:oligosaccharide flippase family protein [Candidatus Krumholzibacteria bacterium]